MTGQVRRSRSTRALAWVLDAALGAAAWLVVWTIAAGGAFWLASEDRADRDIARLAVASGVTVEATGVQVHVDHERAKGGGWDEVDEVRVRLSQNGPWLELDAVANEGTLPAERDWLEGWQEATSETGYALPLDIVVIGAANGTVQHAVATRDVGYWTVDNHDPEIGLAIGSASLVLGAGGAVAWTVWDRLSSRAPGPAYPGDTRAQRRAVRDREEARGRGTGGKRRRHGR